MKKQTDGSTDAVELRQRAEARLRERAEPKGAPRRWRGDTGKLVHELQVHQIELEMQNEEILRSQAQLEASLERYSELYDFAPVGYFSLGRDGTILQVNLTGARLLGVPRSELLNRRLGAFLANAHIAAFNALLSKAFEDHVTESCEVALGPMSTAAGDALSVQLTLSASKGGEECRAIAVDVTERNRAEAQLKAWQTMDAIGRLAGGVAHDLNNLLMVVLAHTELALNAAGEGSPLRGDLLEVKSAVERTAALMRQLLAVGSKQVLRPLVVDVNEQVFQLSKMLSRLLKPKTELVLALAADLGSVQVDPVQLDRVIVNLVLNARDAMPKGGTLTLSTANVTLDDAHARRHPTGQPGPFVVLTVKDTGVGMDEATMTHIFEPFFTTKEQDGGMGFGLSTVYGIVKQCGGEVSVQSELEKGSTFEVYLPRAAAFPKRARPDLLV